MNDEIRKRIELREVMARFECLRGATETDEIYTLKMVNVIRMRGDLFREEPIEILINETERQKAQAFMACNEKIAQLKELRKELAAKALCRNYNLNNYLARS